MTEERKQVATLVGEYPLYKPIIIKGLSHYINQNGFNKHTFDYYCKSCNGDKTFILIGFNFSNQGWNPHFAFVDGKDERRCISNLYKGLCQSCNQYHIDVAIRVEDEGLTTDDGKPLLKARKIGQYPFPAVKLDKDLKKFLDSDAEKVQYDNAINSLTSGYGIGAYSYFRVILQNNIVQLTKASISSEKLSKELQDKIQDAYNNYEQTKHVSKLIEDIKPYLLNSMSLRDAKHPVIFLWQQLSEGLHGEMSDENCLDNAQNIHTVLSHVIRHINENAKSEIELRKILS